MAVSDTDGATGGKVGSVKTFVRKRPRVVVAGVILLYVLLFVVLNNRRVEVNFVFFSLKSHVLLAFALIAVLGFLAGFLVRGRRPAKGSEPPAEQAALPSSADAPSEPTPEATGEA